MLVKIKHILIMLGVALCLLTIVLCSCSQESKETNNVDYCTTANINEMNFDYTDRDITAKYDEEVSNIKLDGANTTSTSNDVTVENTTVNINKGGTYILSGSLDNGQVCVKADDAKVQLVLDGVKISNNNGPAIFVEQANKVFITTLQGTTNEIADYTAYSEDDESYGAIYSKDDLCLNGQGTLNVSSNNKHAISCNDDLTITSGNFVIESAKDGIRANDSVKIKDGVFNVNSGSDCIVATKKDSEKNGYITIDGGTYNLKSQNCCIKAATYIRLNNGNLNCNSNNDAIHNNVQIDINGGTLNVNAKDDAVHTELNLNVNGGTINVESCNEGLEAQEININDGDLSIISSDDPINASVAEWNQNSNMQKKNADDKNMDNNTDNGGFGGERGMQTPPDMQGGQGMQTPPDMQGGPGMQGGQGMQAPPDMQGGSGMQNPPDMQGGPGMQGGQGMQASPDMQGKSAPGGPEMDGNSDKNDDMGKFNEADNNCKITINGGKIYTDSKGDGIDSNGNIEINGGTLIVNGPSSGKDSPIDFGERGTCVVNGGHVLVVGSTGMAENFSGGSQPFGYVLVNGSANSNIELKDTVGNTLNSLVATKSFGIVLCSDPALVDGQKYNINVAGTTYSFTATTSSEKINNFSQRGGMQNGGNGGFSPDGNMGSRQSNKSSYNKSNSILFDNNVCAQTICLDTNESAFSFFSGILPFSFVDKAYADEPENDTYKITGKVKAKGDTEKLFRSDFQIYLDDATGEDYVLTDDKGCFLIENVDTGLHKIKICKEGYVDEIIEDVHVEDEDYEFKDPIEVAPITYTICYDANGGSGNVESKVHVYNSLDTIRTNKFSRDGFKFVEWNTAADGSGSSYSEKDPVWNLTSQNGAVITMYAQWKSEGGGGGGGGHHDGDDGDDSHSSSKHKVSNTDKDSDKSHDAKADKDSSSKHSDKQDDDSNSQSDNKRSEANNSSWLLPAALGFIAGGAVSAVVFIIVLALKSKQVKK